MKAAGGILAGLLLAMLLSSCGGGSGSGSSSSDSGVIASSSVATLADLDLSPGTLDQVFQPSQAAYTARVGFLSPTTTVTPVTSAAAATVSVNGLAVSSGSASAPIPLAIGVNLISVDVTSEDGVNTSSYTLTVTRQTVDEFAQQAYIKASNAGNGDQFGYSLALSGDTLAVGAYREDSNATGINGNQTDNSLIDTGSVYVFICNDGVWSQQAYIKASNTNDRDHFGISLALSGDTLAVGADLEDSDASGIGGNQSNNNAPDSGAVYVYTRSGTLWSQQAYIKASNTDADDRFGFSLALSGDTLAVGANQEDSNASGIGGDQSDNNATDSGAVYVYTRSGTQWSQQAYIKASNTGSDDNFGYSVALSADTLAVGANREASGATGIDGDQNDNSQVNAGAVYVFTRDAAAWSQQAYIKASNAGSGDFFGWSLALSDDTLAVGATGEASNASGINGDQNDNSQVRAGAAYVYIRSGLAWSQQAYIKASNTESEDTFGWSLALSGDNLAVSAPKEDSSSTGVDGDQGNNDLPDSGAAYLFRRSAAAWSQLAYIKASSPGGGDFFGWSLALSGDMLGAGTPGEDSSATGIDGDAADNNLSGSGAAFTFR
jgi:hypothetical protein